MKNEEINDVLEELHSVRPELLNEKSLRLFNAIMSIADERDVYIKNWNTLKQWLEDNWKSSQDIWFVKIINKMKELEKED